MKTIIAGNWKMNLDRSSGAELAKRLGVAAQELRTTELWIAPPTALLSTVAGALGAYSPVRLGGQNVFWEKSGAFTGEVSAPMLLELGCSFALTGHSERRTLFGETDATAAARTVGALEGGIAAIFCIGETLEERTAGRMKVRLRDQLGALEIALSRDAIKSTLPLLIEEGKLLIAYEPVWAIGTGKVASSTEVEEAHCEIQRLWTEGMNLPTPIILYGGSVTPDNSRELAQVPAVDGFLVGGASLDVSRFAAIFEATRTAAAK